MLESDLWRLSSCRFGILRREQRDVVAGGAIDFSDLPPISLSLTLACNLSEKHKKRDTLSH
jgi:hypothetical protein